MSAADLVVGGICPVFLFLGVLTDSFCRFSGGSWKSVVGVGERASNCSEARRADRRGVTVSGVGGGAREGDEGLGSDRLEDLLGVCRSLFAASAMSAVRRRSREK